MGDQGAGRRKGSMCHGGVGQYLLDPSENVSEAIGRFKEGASLYEIDEANRIVSNYIDNWSQRIQPEVLAVEYENSPVHLSIGGYYDAIVKVDGRSYIMEHKFQAERLDIQYNILRRDGQILTYVVLWGDREREKFGDLAGLILDLTDTRGGLKFGRFTVAIEEIAESLQWWSDELKMGIEQAATLEEGIIKPHKRPVCTMERFPCPFEKLCFQGHSMRGAYIERVKR